MKVLIVGGTRFIGPWVARLLVAQGHDVVVFHRGVHTSPMPPSVEHIVDSNAGMPVVSFPDRVRATKPDVVLHMIAMGEDDGRAAADAFAGVAGRIVAASSGDVYRAYGVFTGIESGPLEPLPLTEDSPLRTVRYPYRKPDTLRDALEHFYDKILAESAIASRRELPATCLRLPKVYGHGDNAELATVYGFGGYPHWRWTHGHVWNVAAAIALAVTDNRASGRTYNVGEETTPTVAQRLAFLPTRSDSPSLGENCNCAQGIVYDTGRIRRELGYRELIDERDGMLDVLGAAR